MVFEIYKEKIKERLSRYFDIKEEFIYSNQVYDLFAVSNMRNEKYMASKKLTIYAFENDEYCFMKHLNHIDKDKLQEIIYILKNSIKDFVNPHHEHMSSIITGILVVDGINESDIVKMVKKFHYQKSFAFGLKGWADVRLLLVNLEKAEVIPSKKAKNAVKFFEF